MEQGTCGCRDTEAGTQAAASEPPPSHRHWRTGHRNVSSWPSVRSADLMGRAPCGVSSSLPPTEAARSEELKPATHVGRTASLPRGQASPLCKASEWKGRTRPPGRHRPPRASAREAGSTWPLPLPRDARGRREAGASTAPQTLPRQRLHVAPSLPAHTRRRSKETPRGKDWAPRAWTPARVRAPPPGAQSRGPGRPLR